MNNGLDYIHLGLVVKARWTEIDPETVKIHEVPFGKDSFEICVVHDWPDERMRELASAEPKPYWTETIEMHRVRIGKAEFMAGYGFNKLLVGIKK